MRRRNDGLLTVDKSTAFRCKADGQPCSEGDIMFLCAKRTAGT